MKKYGILLLIVFVLMVLIPLPNYPFDESKKSPGQLPGNEAADAFDGMSFLVLDSDSGKVIEMSERDFIIGTVSCEMSPTYDTEALKAQAVAAYTYYSVKRARARSADTPDKSLAGADFSDVPTRFPEGYSREGMKERFGEKATEYYDKIAAAVDAVLGQKIYYKGEPIVALYHAISPGTTEIPANVWGGSYPYLRSVPSPGDLLAPQYETTISVSADDFAAKMKTIDDTLKPDDDPKKWLEGKPTCSDAGTVLSIKVMGKAFTGAEMRTAFGLRSACFTLAYQEDTFTFTVKGYGHGDGMSQYGANYLAEQGADYREILTFYYTDVEIRTS